MNTVIKIRYSNMLCFWGKENILFCDLNIILNARHADEIGQGNSS